MMEEIEFRWFLESAAPYLVERAGSRWIVSCEGSALYWARRRSECDHWAQKMEGVRIEWAATVAAEAAAAAEARACAQAARAARAASRAAAAAAQYSFAF